MSATEEQLSQAASMMDPHLVPCPACGGQLRAEYKKEWRSIAEAAALHGVPEVVVMTSGAKLDAFGRVLCGVPFVTCMECGLHADGSQEAVVKP